MVLVNEIALLVFEPCVILVTSITTVAFGLVTVTVPTPLASIATVATAPPLMLYVTTLFGDA